MPGEPLERIIRLPGRAVRAMLTRWVVVCAVAGLATGCSTLPRNALPTELMGTAVIPGMPDVRAPAGRPSLAMSQDLARSFEQESPDEFPLGPDGAVHYANLALSGGGANGAYGAGFLNGWTTTGKRPVFKIVTGVSTGALMAPFAFLGPAYDDALREFYTTNSSRNIFRALSFIPQLLGGESFADTTPLRALIEQHVDAEFLRQIAQAHAAGRRLYVGTVDLDSQRLVVWNMGLIAASGRPEALALFRQVMLASASIPVAFPPVFFEVEAGGQRYDEMHVDGAVEALQGAALDLLQRCYPIRRCPRHPEGRPCVRADHGRCLAPCSGDPLTRTKHDDLVREIVAWLSGRSDADLAEPLERAGEVIGALSRQRRFEEAQSLREARDHLLHVRQSYEALAEARRLRFAALWPVTGNGDGPEVRLNLVWNGKLQEPVSLRVNALEEDIEAALGCLWDTLPTNAAETAPVDPPITMTSLP